MLGPDPLPAASPEQPVAAATWPADGANAWLAQHPAVAAAVVWETDGGALPWASWDRAGKLELEEAFAAELAALKGTGSPLGFPLQDPPENLMATKTRVLTVLAPHDAFRLYVAHVGHSIALEVLHTLPWSIATDTPDSLHVLLDGQGMFTYRGNLGGYLIDPGRAGYAVPGPPAMELGFLIRQKLLGATRRETIERLITWARRLRHFTGKMENHNAQRIWQYPGVPPVSRVLAGTGPSGYHYTAGCWGTTGLFISVLRAANIPVRLVDVRGQGSRAACSHAQPYFVSEHVFLSHGDDPYSQLITTEDGAVPARRLFLDASTWKAWFGEPVDPHARCANIGRAVMEIALETLPGYVEDAYCEDLRTGADPRAGKVARTFGVGTPGSAFTIERLNEARLWDRLAEKVTRTNACATKHPPPAVSDPPETVQEP